MPTEYVKSDGLVKYGKNPFVEGLVKNAKLGLKTQGRVKTSNGFVSHERGTIDLQTGEVLDEHLVIAVKKTVDKEQFVKIFIAGLEASHDLPKQARDVFVTLLKSYNDMHMPVGGSHDLIFFSYRDAVEAGYKRKQQTFRSGMNVLCHKEILAPATKGRDWYFINPMFFYKGDRMTIFNHYVYEDKPVINVDEPNGDVELDQVSLIDGKTERQRRAEKRG